MDDRSVPPGQAYADAAPTPDELTDGELDTLVRVVDPRRWVALVTIGVILAGAVVWGLVGRLESTARAWACVVIPRGGTCTIQAAVAGTVLSVLVQRGDHVNEGQTVAMIETASGQKAPVEAPFSGTVIELLETHSDYVSVGGPIVSFESDEEALGALVYVSPAISASLRPGMDVRVSPATSSRDQYRFLLGTVEEVALVPYLRGLGWSGDGARLHTLVAGLTALTGRVGVMAEVGDTAHDTVGLECFLGRRWPQVDAGWPALLDQLVRQGLCTAQQRAALLGYPGHAPAAEAPTRGQLAAAALLGGRATGGYLRRLNHVKVTCAPGLPLEA